jgi:hypothetical protein
VRHLLETRALAIFISNSLVQDITPLSSSSTPQTQTNNVKSYTEKTTNNTINNTGTTNNGTNIQGITNNTGINTAGTMAGPSFSHLVSHSSSYKSQIFLFF